ncbi:MAG TPA: hypothetical protein DCY35_06315 [Prolixibacteraceae bacterium]|nr:hypothetical protein [Prolixibacteraceae bacterium]
MKLLQENDLPNIIFIFADDVGYGDIGCYGAEKISTPNIDNIAREGMKFTDAHACSAVCTPSRYGLLTGEYAWRKNIYRPLYHYDPLQISTDMLTLPRMLQSVGYKTACIGKWHLGFGTDMPDWNGELAPGPLESGFDYYYGIPVVSSHPPFVYVENHHIVGLDENDPLLLNDTVVNRYNTATEVYPGKYGIDTYVGGQNAHLQYRARECGIKLTNKAIDWMAMNKEKRFFLYFSTPHIHVPFTPAERFIGSSQCGIYGDYMQELDWMVGVLTKAVDELGIRNTMIIFMSDNGGMLTEGGKAAWQSGHHINGELLGFKFDAWEGGHRVPLVASWPNHIPKGKTSRQLISNIDFFATFSSLV